MGWQVFHVFISTMFLRQKVRPPKKQPISLTSVKCNGRRLEKCKQRGNIVFTRSLYRFLWQWCPFGVASCPCCFLFYCHSASLADFDWLQLFVSWDCGGLSHVASEEDQEARLLLVLLLQWVGCSRRRPFSATVRICACWLTGVCNDELFSDVDASIHRLSLYGKI